MSRAVSPSTQPVLRRAAGDPGLGRVAGHAVSSSPMRRDAGTRRRPGPLGPMSDAALVEAIRELLAAQPVPR